LIAWKVLLEGLSTSNTHALRPIWIDIFAVLMKKAARKAHVFAIHEEIHFSVRLL
jgi:hypothetical protein